MSLTSKIFNNIYSTKCTVLSHCRNVENIYNVKVVRTLYQKSENQFNVIIVGGGHAGTEACAASARMGVKTLLITHKKSMIGAMSCNPSFGGIGKGHLMKEIDALDGLCGRICDLSGIHYKILNKRKGPAVWGYRAQIDRSLYKKELQRELFALPNLTIKESSVEDLILKYDEGSQHPKCSGVVLSDGEEILSDSVVLTTGTFLRGCIILGLETRPAGRMDDESSIGLANTLERLEFKLGRLKTGTPPRIDKNTVDFSVCDVQEPDYPPLPFSFMNESVWIKPEDQLRCYMTYTNPQVDKMVKDSLHLNRHSKEEVNGPRYCPSLEAKVLRYPGREHQVWLEPEGLDSSLIYPQGLTITMPPDIQQKLVRLLPGLERCEIVQPGYGVEYDFVNPQELTRQLETKKVGRLFFAGQINGTTGYEEAAAQGIIAGINAAAKSTGKAGIKVDRTEGYIGVLIDDLTSHGTSEPYRMFTFRSEFRMRLRPDNADIRLTAKGYEVGCVSKERFQKMTRTRSEIDRWRELLKNDVRPCHEWLKLLPDLPKLNENVKRSAFEVLGLLPLESTRLAAFFDSNSTYEELGRQKEVFRRVLIEGHYRTPLIIEAGLAKTLKINEAFAIPSDFDYYQPSLNISKAIREKLNEARPTSISAANKIPGITAPALLALLNHIKMNKTNYRKVS